MDADQVIRWYFSGEKAEAFWIALAGGLSLAAVIVLWFWVREPFARGLAVALLLIAALGLGVGGAVYVRSDSQARQLLEQRTADPAAFAAQEGPRIRTVVASFPQYRIGYALAVLAALVLVFVWGKPFQQGLAVGLLLLAALGFTIDFYAERRAHEYVRGLETHGLLSPAG